tara:strand:+ start:179 stop:445 length:267 start_codon:yes stop_codon:yes gene_type:complete
MGMLKDMQSQYGPTSTTKQSDVLAGEGKKNTGLEGLGANNASKYSVTKKRDPLAFEGKKNSGLEGIKDGSLYGLTGKGPKAYIDTVEL